MERFNNRYKRDMKTAVEWLVNMLVTENEVTLKGENFKLFEQAKEMEKEQIIDATYYGHLKGWVDCGVENSFGEQYYNETFKSE